MNRFDAPIERAQSYARQAILNEPDVIDHLVSLGDLLHASRLFRAGPLPYWRARERSPLREHFAAGQLDHFAAVIRGRLHLECWGLAIPVGDSSAGYGRQKARARAMTVDAIELGVADLARKLNPEREPRALAESHPGTVRTARRRLRRLPAL